MTLNFQRRFSTLLPSVFFAFLLLLFTFALMNPLVAADNKTIRIFTWKGYVTAQDVARVNKLLHDRGYEYQVEVIQPWAENPDQMFQVLRSGKADISFLTLNYIGRYEGRTSLVLQPINLDSPRLGNVKYLLPEVQNIPMGLDDNYMPLYLPFGGGAYGIWANMSKLKREELPHSVKDLWNTRWHGTLSLTGSQIEPNIALALMALDYTPFHLNHMVGDRKKLMGLIDPQGQLQRKLNNLYQQVGTFWDAYPDFESDHLLIASYGIAAAEANAKGGNWRLVPLKEGNTVWLDTINFHRSLAGRKLEAAEICANYFIGADVQSRIVDSLGMVAASTLASHNPLLEDNPNFYKPEFFWPPYFPQAANAMKRLSDRAMKSRAEQE